MNSKAIKFSFLRIVFVCMILVIFLLIGISRVFSLQILESDRGPDFLKKEGSKRSHRAFEIPAYRGVITDRHGESLAVSTPVVSIFANPSRLKSVADRTLFELSVSIGIPLDELKAKIAKYHNKDFMYLARQLSPDAARSILSQNYPGIFEKKEYRRFYPAGEAVAHVVGITNVDGRGIEGIELAYDKWLSGEAGQKRYIKNLHGDAVRDIGVVKSARPGGDIRLSIDLRLQHIHHRELRRAMNSYDAESASLITLDAKTGEILAMVSEPGYNPNNRLKVNIAAVRNRVLADSYEPGSTVKPFTLVAALESGRFKVDTYIDTSPGEIEIDGKVLRDQLNYGSITLSRAIVKSSQVGITKLALQLGGETIYEVFRRFGIGEPVNVGFPGESWGLLPRRSIWAPIQEANLAFGYGLRASPIQIAKAYSVFANNGFQQPISLLALETNNLPRSSRILSPTIANQVLRVLKSVTEEGGTGFRAKVPGYSVGGKTGTVRKLGLSGYEQDQHIALFVGIMPVDDPRFVTVVVIDKPKGDKYHGGTVAAPVFSKVAEATLRLMNIPPQKEKVKFVFDSLSLGDRV